MLSRINLFVFRWLLRAGDKRRILGLDVVSCAGSEAAFEKLEAALRLIKEQAPGVFGNLRKDVQSILIAGSGSSAGLYVHQLKLIEIYHKHLLDPEISVESLACLIVHEAQHARLFRLGFGYDRAVRARIERICFTAERNFARKLAGNEDLAASAQQMIDSDLDYYASPQGRADMELAALKQKGWPNWLISFFAWAYRNFLPRPASSK